LLQEWSDNVTIIGRLMISDEKEGREIKKRPQFDDIIVK
jgi:hypothetical protein